MSLLEFRQKYLYQIQLYINTKCNLFCDYCYARKNYKWGEEIEYEKIDSVLKKINKYLKNSFISFIGGEPTIYPNFKNLLKNSLKYENLTFHFYTNGKKKLKEILNFDNFNQIKITLSLHKSLDKKSYQNFKENIIFLQENNCDFNLTFVFYDDPEFQQFFLEIYDIIEDKNRIYISFIHDYFNVNEFEIYKKNYMNFIQNLNVNTYNFKERKIKQCYYNELIIKFELFPHFILNNCINKFIDFKKLKKIKNKFLITKNNLKILAKKRKYIICSENCPLDPAFYGSWKGLNNDIKYSDSNS